MTLLTAREVAARLRVSTAMLPETSGDGPRR